MSVRKLQATGRKQYTLTIPKTLIEVLKWNSQDEITLELKGNEIVLRKGVRK